MHRQAVYVVCAEGEEELAETRLAQPLREAGYDVTHTGTVVVGESLVGEAAKALAAGSPIVLCATTRAAGSQWAHHIVNAGHAGGPVRVFVVKMEKQAYVEHLALKSRVANYCDNPGKALHELLAALAKHFPPVSDATAPSKENTTATDHQFLDQLTQAVTFDIEALQIFRGELRKEVAMRYPDALSAWEFLDRAELRVDGRLTRTGALLFGKNPTVACPMTMVKCVRYYGTDRAAEREIVTYEETVPAQIVAARQFVADQVRRGEAPSAEQAQSAMVYDYPMIAVREIIANALVHRDYTFTDACVHVRIFADRLEVSSPGTWLGRDLLIGNKYDLADLEGQSIKRNSRLAHVLSWIRIVEGEGSGIPSAIRDCENMQSTSPTVAQEQGFVTVTLRRRILDNEALSVPGQSSAGLIADFGAALRRLQQHSGLSRAELARRVRATCSRTQLHAILDSKIRTPPRWDRVVEPLVRICTNNDEGTVAEWWQRYSQLVREYDVLRRLDRQRPPLAPAAVAPVVPAQLPADVDAFTGRTGELAELDKLLVGVAERTTVHGGVSRGVVISAVSGTAGVGKTALAVRWAHRVRDEFPDGQLYVDLRGYDTEAPLSASDALAGFLRALGVGGADIPLGVDERAAAYRSLLDERRMLLVLDNASSVEQIRPLLPGAEACRVLVTSRDSLAGLVIRHGATRLDLDLLAPGEAVALLQTLIGTRVRDEPVAAVTLAQQCAGLPLALRVAAELAAAQPDTSLAELVAGLGDEQRRLELLEAGGDPRTALRAVFSWSYHRLPAEAARVFRLIGLHLGPDLDPYAVAALTERTRDQAQYLLQVLVRGHLLALTRPGRYGMHNLLRVYAIQLASVQESDQEQRAALTRLFDYYLATAAAAMDTLVPAERHRRPRIPEPGPLLPPVADPAAAQAWLDTERATLTAVCAHTAAHGWPTHTIRLATTLSRYLDIGGHYADALTIHTHALRAARHTDDRPAQAQALTHLGLIYQWQGPYSQAIEHLQQALALARELGDRDGEAQAVSNLGIVYERLGYYHQAAEHLQQALTLARELGDRDGEAQAVSNLGIVYRQQNHFPQALDHHYQALTLFREIGNRRGETGAHNGAGEVHHATGHYPEAHLQHTAALALATEIGERYEQARAHHGLARAHHATGNLDQARHHYRKAHTLYTDLGVPEPHDIQTHLTTLNQLDRT